LAIISATTENDDKLKAFVQAQWHTWRFDVLRYDSTGFGHLLKFDLDAGVIIQPVNFGGSGGERFSNARALIYARTAKIGVIYLNSNDYRTHSQQLMKELKSTKYKFDDSKKLALEPKKEVKKEIGRSPDRADGLCLAFSYVPEAKAMLPRVPRRALAGINPRTHYP